MKIGKKFSAFIAAFVLCLPTLATSGVPVPTVQGPIPVTSTSHPFNSMYYATVPIDLAAFGYVEEEYFVSGFANVYTYGTGYIPEIQTPNVPYTTRILVIRPVNFKRFSGNVVVEPIHTSNGGSYPIWGNSHDYFLAHGDAYVLITVPTTVPTLKIWDPERYAPLSVLSVTCPGQSPAPEHGLIYDIISQVGALLKSNSSSNPLAGFNVKYLYATGFSYTGMLITAYVNFIHPLATLDSEEYVYDGYVIGGAGSPWAINQCSPSLPGTDPRAMIPPRGVPVFRVMTQADFIYGGWQFTRRPDSDTYPDLFRLYEVPGATHFSIYPRLSYPNADELARIGLIPPVIICTSPAQPNNFPYRYILNGTFANLDLWVREGPPPPQADRIAVTGTPPATLLDGFGNAVGGIRTPYVDVPTVTYYPTMNPVVNCEVPFSEGLLKQLYPNHGKYVNNVIHHTNELVQDLWVTHTDGQTIKTDAAHADVP